MRRIILAASVAIATLAMPAMGQDPGGHGQGAEHGGGPRPDVGQGGGLGQDVAVPVSPNANDNASGQVQADVRAGTDSRASDRAEERTGASVDRTPDTDGDDTEVDDDDGDGDDASQLTGSVATCALRVLRAATRPVSLRDRRIRRSPWARPCRTTSGSSRI